MDSRDEASLGLLLCELRRADHIAGLRWSEGRVLADVETWAAEAASGLLAPFVSRIVRNRAAVQTALKEPPSSDQTEGQNTRLKLIKWQMYGRAKLDLPRARLLSAP